MTALNLGCLSISLNLAVLAPFISLSSVSPFELLGGKSGAAFLIDKTSLAHKRREVGRTALAPLPRPSPWLQASLLLCPGGTQNSER